MNITTEQYERIIRFLDAAMTMDEMEAFEKELEASPAMRQQLDFEQSVRDSFASKKDKEILAQEIISKRSQDERANKIPVRNINRKRWVSIAVAASVVTAVITIAFLKTKKNTTPGIVQGNDSTGIKKKDTVQLVILKPVDSSKPKLFALLYKQYFAVDTLPETYPMFLAEAFINYENEDYAAIQKLNLTSIPELRSMGSKQIILELGHYYKGIAFLKTNNTQQAIVNLQWAEKNSKDGDLKLKAEWYLALAYIKSSNVSEAESLLKKIAGNSTYHRYNSKAKNLLKALQE